MRTCIPPPPIVLAAVMLSGCVSPIVIEQPPALFAQGDHEVVIVSPCCIAGEADDGVLVRPKQWLLAPFVGDQLLRSATIDRPRASTVRPVAPRLRRGCSALPHGPLPP